VDKIPIRVETTLILAKHCITLSTIFPKNGDTILVDEGVYLVKSQIPHNLTIKSASETQSVIFTNQQPPMFIVNAFISLLFEGIYFMNGLSVGVTTAVYVSLADRIQFINCTFNNNTLDGPIITGGILRIFNANTVVFTNCRFSNNNATSHSEIYGGVIALNNVSHVSFHSCVFVGNSASIHQAFRVWGSLILIDECDDFEIEGCVFEKK